MTQPRNPWAGGLGPARRAGSGVWAAATAVMVCGLWLLAPPAAAAASGWAELTAQQRQVLAPLRGTWDQIDATRRQKWLEVAERFPRMPADEQRRVQERMAAWSALSPAERARARLQFQESRQITAEERQARWQAYQALPEEERKRLAANAKQARTASAPAERGPAPVSVSATGAKRNIVAVGPSPAPRSVAPTVVQNKPGVSTNTIVARSAPPVHHQPGLPKIVATPSFVDPKTLLPRRGPQAAAMRTAASSDPTQQP